MGIILQAKCQRCEKELGFTEYIGFGTNQIYYCEDCKSFAIVNENPPEIDRWRLV